jgi:hypothetical protein
VTRKALLIRRAFLLVVNNNKESHLEDHKRFVVEYAIKGQFDSEKLI